MEHCIFVGCDVHVKTLLLRVAVDKGEAQTHRYRNNRAGREALLKKLGQGARAVGGARVLLAYETSSLGYVLYDEVVGAGFECYVIATTKMPRTWKHVLEKTDERDAQLLLDLLRSHMLAGTVLASVWVPTHQQRDDREMVRARLDIVDKLTRVKTQVRSLLCRYDLRCPADAGKGWTQKFLAWLDSLVGSSTLGYGASVRLGVLLAEFKMLKGELDYVDEQMKALASTERHGCQVAALREEKGVGLVTALTFLVEMGDMERFSNRRQVGSYLGLVPRCHESGESSERKGHITRHGPPRVRRVLGQAVGHWVRWSPEAKARYERMIGERPEDKKRLKRIAKVAMMRRLGIRLWQRGLEAGREGAPPPTQDVVTRFCTPAG